jgi:hypothetical protein
MASDVEKFFASANLVRAMKAAACSCVLMLAAGCQTVVYEGDVGKQALMSLAEARRVVGSEVGKASFGGGYFEDVQVTIKGFSVNSPAAVAFIPAGRYSFQFARINHVAVIHEGETFAIDIGPPWYVHWKSEADVRHFLDAVRTMKYYASGRPLADDTASFAEFRKLAGTWRALPTKPPLPDRAQQFRVLAEDALHHKISIKLRVIIRFVCAVVAASALQPCTSIRRTGDIRTGRAAHEALPGTCAGCARCTIRPRAADHLAVQAP